MKRSIIFSQAPAKAIAVLNCYEHELSEGREITIVVRTNLKGLYQFYKGLGLKANIQMIEDRGSVLCFWKTKRQNKELARLLNLNKIDDIRVFFTDIYDFGMGKIMSSLMPFDPVHILSPLDITDKEYYGNKRYQLPFIKKCKEFIGSYICKVPLCHIYGEEECWVLVMDNRKLKFKTLDYSDRRICTKYKKTISSYLEKCVIFFTEPYRFFYQSKEEYDEMNRKIINEIHQAGYKVAVKGHPRIGCQEDAQQMADEVLPNYIPAEFIDFSTFEFAIGFTSTSLCEVSNDIKAYSVFKMCTVTDYKVYLYFEEYMERNGPKVKFIKSYSDIFK